MPIDARLRAYILEKIALNEPFCLWFNDEMSWIGNHPIEHFNNFQGTREDMKAILNSLARPNWNVRFKNATKDGEWDVARFSIAHEDH